MLAFWQAVDRLVAECPLVLERLAGTPHPNYPDKIYPLDYGYLDGTRSSDGCTVDVWVGSLAKNTATALLATIDLLKRDVELKIILGGAEQDLAAILEFTNQFSMTGMLTRRDEYELPGIALAGLQLLRTRRSVREFDLRPVPRPLLEKAIETATWAPSAHNAQPWRFLVFDSLSGKSSLAQAMGAQFRRDLLVEGHPQQEIEQKVSRSIDRIQNTPVVVILCLNEAEVPASTRPPRGELIMAMQSVALAGGQLLLAAHALGLAGVWMCAPLFAQKAVQEELNLPATWQPQAMLLLGYPDEQLSTSDRLPARERRPLAEVVRYY